MSRAADAEETRVRSFAAIVATESMYPTEPGQLEAAALAAIDSANNEPATASSLVRAAMAGVLNSLGHGAQLLPPSDTLKHETQQEPRHASFRDVGQICVITCRRSICLRRCLILTRRPLPGSTAISTSQHRMVLPGRYSICAETGYGRSTPRAPS